MKMTYSCRLLRSIHSREKKKKKKIHSRDRAIQTMLLVRYVTWSVHKKYLIQVSGLLEAADEEKKK